MTFLEIRLKQILKDTIVGCKHIENRSTPEYLGLDSYNSVLFFEPVEAMFDIDIDDEKFAGLKNFGEMVKYIKELI